MPLVGFQPTIPVFDRAKTVHALRLRGHCDWHVNVRKGKNVVIGSVGVRNQ
jgi:hypothetical protein